MKKEIFRKVALERLSSPEQLDTLLVVTSPKGWVALIALFGLLCAAILYGFMGSIPTKVNGQGILMRSGGVFRLESLSGGRVIAVNVKVGDIIQSGQVVARIEQPDLIDKIADARFQMENSQDIFDSTISSQEEGVGLRRQYIIQQKENLQLEIDTLNDNVENLELTLAKRRELYDRGLVTQNEILSLQYDIDKMKLTAESKKNSLKQLDGDLIRLETENKSQVMAESAKIERQKINIDILESSLERNSKIIAPYSGRVIELIADTGDLIGAGAPVMVIELLGENMNELQGVIYSPPFDAKKVKSGMKINIAPSFVKQEEFGFMEGIVVDVNEYPSTSEGMMLTLQNDTLVRMLSSEGPPIKITAALIPDATTVSGYKWSSPKGPPLQIQSGTFCFATITVTQQRPITLVIPILKKFILGIGGSRNKS